MPEGGGAASADASSGGSRVGVVLAGGGARGAYELGALSELLPLLEARGQRPSVYTGTSVGAINAASLLANHHLPAAVAVSRTLERWREVDRGAVIQPVLARLPLTLLRFVGQTLSLPRVRLSSLLDPTPLQDNLSHWIDWPQLHRNIHQVPECLGAVLATSAHSGRAVAFVEGHSIGEFPHSHVIDYVPARLEQAHVSSSRRMPVAGTSTARPA